MALVIGQAVLVRVIWNLSGQPYAVNVLGARKSGATAIDQAFVNTLGAAMKAGTPVSLFLGGIANIVTLANIGVRDISAPNLPEFLDAGAAVPGASATKLLPPQTAVCVTLRTAKVGKSYRGRVFLPGAAETVLTTTGLMTAGMQTNAAGLLTGWRTNFTASGLTMAILSRKNSTSEDVTLAQCRDVLFDTQRRRAIAGI